MLCALHRGPAGAVVPGVLEKECIILVVNEALGVLCALHRGPAGASAPGVLRKEINFGGISSVRSATCPVSSLWCHGLFY